VGLSLRVLREAPAEPVLSVDGAFGCRGLNLSHWPGHTTPDDLRHELSTGSALAFARLSEEERTRRAAGCALVVNNHYDTDGACALYAVLHPERALAHAQVLLDVAAAGDFFRAPSELALSIDAAIGNLGDPERSEFGRALRGLSDLERHERCYAHVVERLDAWLAGDLRSARGLYEFELDAYRADRKRLASAQRIDTPRHDLSSWLIPEALLRGADPGRHALFGATRRDRVLVAFPREGGSCYRLVVSTLSWFDIPGRTPSARPDLAALARHLDALGGATRRADASWHAQPHASPSPELWYGRAELAFFSERNAALEPCVLAPEVVHAELVQWLDDHAAPLV
jgi:hypothetical protein